VISYALSKMALAKYISKNILAIRQALSQGSVEAFGKILSENCIEIAFDDQCRTREGIAMLDLLTRLLARLYPRMKFTDISSQNGEIKKHLQEIALSINSLLTLDDGPASFCVVIGKTRYASKGAAVYAGSHDWVAKTHGDMPCESLDSANPFGAGIAACLAAGTVFRTVFASLLGKDIPAENTILDLLSLGSHSRSTSPDLASIDLKDTHLVGLGAVGNGALWAFSKLTEAKGNIIAIDHETVALSNLQRYVCISEADEGKGKAELASRLFAETSIKCQPYSMKWNQYMAIPGEKNLELVLSAVDSAMDRIGIQSSLPKYIINGYTENRVGGVTRHMKFGEQACLACGFVPEKKMRDYSQEVADNLGISQLENQVRHYIAYNFPVDDKLLAWIAQANGIDQPSLSHHVGKAFNTFYSDEVCGGLLLTLTGGDRTSHAMEAPLAFQSALVGILLASETILFRAGVRRENFVNSMQHYPLLAIKNDENPYLTQLAIDSTGRCICQDEDFRTVYYQRWFKEIDRNQSTDGVHIQG
jgi:molybdopterin/thiamine biosynthesis adenylyltransferase